MSWNSQLYDTKHSFVSKYGEDVVAMLNPQRGEQILDAGCGTGDLANMISESGAVVTGIDSSEKMIEKARQKYPSLDFEVASVSDYVMKNFYDAVFSNATLHWVSDNVKAANCFYKNLKNGGRFIAEFGGKGNVQGMADAIKSSLIKFGFEQNINLQQWYFPSIAAYAKVLEDAGFCITDMHHFNRKDWVKMFGINFFKGIDEEAMAYILDDIQNALKPTHFKNGNWYADYVRLRVRAIKKSPPNPGPLCISPETGKEEGRA